MGDHNTSSSGQGSRRGGRKRALDEDHLTEEERAKKQKNRDAAKKCRQRKIEEAKNLKEDNEKLENENKRLTKKKSDLELNIARCKKLIEQHVQHGCQLPEELKRLLDDDLASVTDGDQDFCPVGIRTICGSSNVSSMYQMNGHHQSFNFCENGVEGSSSQSKIPTGLFSGTHLQMSKDNPRKSVTIVKNQSPSGNDIVNTNSQQASDSPLTQHSSLGCQDEDVQWIEVSDGLSKSPSPAQRVPNIDQTWSPHSTKVDDSGVDENVSPAQHIQTYPATVNVIPTTALNNFSGGLFVNNIPISVSQDNSTLFQFQNGKVDCPRPDNSGNFSMKTSHLYPNGVLRNKQTSFPMTESLQVTKELISQAIQDMSPTEISKSLHDQIIECAKPESSTSNSKEVEDKDYLIEASPISVEDEQPATTVFQTQPQYVIEDKPAQTVLIQTENSEDSNTNMLVDTYSFYNTGDNLNSSIVSYQNNPHTVTVTGAVIEQYNPPQFTQSYVIEKQDGGQELITLPYVVNNVNPILQTQPVQVDEEVEASQIPTTVLSVSDDEDVIESAPQEVGSNTLTHQTGQEVDIVDTCSLSSITLNNHYNDVVSELPSLSFNDLQNQPKEIFNKKPSRLCGKSLKKSSS